MGIGTSRPAWATATIAAALLAACQQDPDGPPGPLPGYDGVDELAAPLTAVLDAQCAWDGDTRTLALTVLDDQVVIVSSRTSGSIVVNGHACPAAPSSPINRTTIKALTVTNAAANNGAQTVILDYVNGLFALGASGDPAGSGTTVAFGANAGDAVKLRTLKTNDTVTCGNDTESGNRCNLNNDSYPDLTITSAANLTVALGPGVDVFRASGDVVNGDNPLPVSLVLKVFGGPGNDVLRGGNGNDTLFGDEDRDTLEAEDHVGGNDTFWGGSGTDTVTYAARGALHGLLLTVGDGTNDGEDTDDNPVNGAEEHDLIKGDVENVTGGPGNDLLVGNENDNTLSGGPGNDTLRGGANLDILNGDDGDDRFDEEASPTGADTFNGGAGIDTVDYSLRTDPVLVTIGVDTDRDGQDLGTVGTSDALDEGDKVTSTVENVIGGAGNDRITGSSANNTLTGNGGSDYLDGASGDDTFDESTDSKGAGADTFRGGSGKDTVVYTSRTTAITMLAENTTVGSPNLGYRLASDGTSSDKLDSLVEHIVGTAQNDTLYGAGEDDELEGQDGNDSLFGEDGDDILSGGAGDDSIDCGTGGDLVFPGIEQVVGVIAANCGL